MEGLIQCSANYVPLTPISFLERAANVFGDKLSIVYGTTRFTWRETHARCLKLASALVQLGITRGDVVAALAPNIPALYELHFGVPMAGAVLSGLNTKLDSGTMALILEQLNAKLIFVDYQFVDGVQKALDLVSQKLSIKPPQLVLIPEFDQATSPIAPPQGHKPCSLDYNDLLEMEQADEFRVIWPDNECYPISVNYTSGSTGNPKGVVYSHRAAYLNSLGEIFRCNMRPMPVFLWTVDMFRCNGWCLPWTMAALGGTNVCLRKVSAEIIFDSILLHNVTHFCGPPALLNIIADAPRASYQNRPLPTKVNVVIAGVLPTSGVLTKVEELGFNVNHGYGMTEALGPAIVEPRKCDETTSSEGLHNVVIEGVDVKDPNTMKSVPNDGKTIGEVMFRSNTMMSGYLKNPRATQEAFKGGWYHTGDLGVRQPNGWIRMKDRAKDIIVNSGGETISTLEVEAVLSSHSHVLEAAVVGKPDNGLFKEVPCAFVKVKEGYEVSAEEIIEFCANQLPKHMVPRKIVFGDLPVNFNGKVQKSILRDRAQSMSGLDIS